MVNFLHKDSEFHFVRDEQDFRDLERQAAGIKNSCGLKSSRLPDAGNIFNQCWFSELAISITSFQTLRKLPDNIFFIPFSV
jgi:hypothetical protein